MRLFRCAILTSAMFVATLSNSSFAQSGLDIINDLLVNGRIDSDVNAVSILRGDASDVHKGSVAIFLNPRMRQAYVSGNYALGDKYQEALSCATHGKCDYIAELQRIAQGSGQTPSNEATFPNINTTWSSSYGDIHWSAGWYGTRNKTLSYSQPYLDGDTYVVSGTWGRRDDSSKTGGFEFRFSGSCSFNGYWWYGNDPGKNAGGWSGNCK